MAQRVVWLRAAERDVESIATYIAADSEAYASAVVKRVLQAAADLKDFPHRGRMVPEWGDESIREVYVHRFRLMYRVRDDRIEILTVIHGARLLSEGLQYRQ